MFIKATPTSSNSDYQGTLQAVMQYIRNMNSYSTEEKWTGGYWIDGKPIYRRVFTGLNYGATTGWYNDGAQIPNAEKIVNAWSIRNSDNAVVKFIGYRLNSNKYVESYHQDFGGCDGLVVEYTKTTD